MPQEHPITPSLELVENWFLSAKANPPDQWVIDVATQAARWGSDQELEACCHEAQKLYGVGRWLRSIRRPESLKAQGLKALDSFEGFTGSLEEVDIIRRALESLPE